MESEASGRNLTPEFGESDGIAPSCATSNNRTKPYQPPYQRLQERWRLSHEQQALRAAVKRDIAERWPRLNFDVAPVHKLLKRGELEVPGDDAWFGVGYENGPLLMEMREVIDGRSRICVRSATIGSILWVHGQSAWRDMLGGAGRVVIQPFDLSAESIREEVNAIDAWAHTVGRSGMDVSKEEGWEVLFSAQRAAAKSGDTWPRPTDAGMPVWNWRQPMNALNPPR